MSDNKHYYYLKFKENYFDQDHIKVIESMQNGHTYSLILIKLYLKSLKFDGQLKINERIPYHKNNVQMLAGVLNHDSDHVMKAINLASSLGIIDIFDTGEMFMVDIHNFIGKSSTEADRKRAYRTKLEEKKKEKLIECDMGHLSGRSSPEIEIELELDIDIEKKKNSCHFDNSAEIQELFKGWIKSGCLVKHNKDVVKKRIEKKHVDIVNAEGIDRMKEAILNYYKIMSDKDSYKEFYTHVYDFWEFILKKYSKYTNDKNPLERYLA